MKRVGIFGGSFDPPHLGHLVIAQLAQRELGLDVVFLVPAYQPPHKKGGHATSAGQRLAMTKLAVRGNPGLRVSDIEIRRRGVSYTVDTVEAFHEKFPHSELFLIIGSDSLRQFNSWKDPEGILEMASLAVYRRHGRTGTPSRNLKTKLYWIEGPIMELSSTEIRKRLSNGKSIDQMVRANVLALILRKGLYQQSSQRSRK